MQQLLLLTAAGGVCPPSLHVQPTDSVRRHAWACTRGPHFLLPLPPLALPPPPLLPCRYLLRVTMTGKGMGTDTKKDAPFWVRNYDIPPEEAPPIKMEVRGGVPAAAGLRQRL